MSPVTLAILGIVILTILMLLRMPIGFAMLLVGTLGFSIVVSPSAALSMISSEIWMLLSSYSFSVVPMFVLMGQILYHAQVTDKLFNVAYKWVGQFNGGMAATTIAACTLFSCICGSNGATVATMGKAALPEMKKYKYDPALNTGSVAVGGTLGVMIPPSVALLIISLFTGQSVRVLFMAVILPGFLLSGLLLATVFLICKIYPRLGPPGPKTSFIEKISSLPGIIELIILFLLVIGGLYAGWFTPTEAGSVGAFGALMIALMQKRLSWEKFSLAMVETLQITAMVVIFIAGAQVLNRFLAVTRIPFILADWLGALPISSFLIMIVIILIYLLGGAFMDEVGFLLLTLPIFLPVAKSIGYDPVWFVILVVLLTTMGHITPPFGLNIFIVRGLAPDVPMKTIFKGVFIFIPAYLVCVALLLQFPQIVLFLPSLM